MTDSISLASRISLCPSRLASVPQVYGGLVYMDFSRALMEERGYGEYRYLSPGDALPPLFLAYLADPSDSGKMHSDISLRWKRG